VPLFNNSVINIPVKRIRNARNSDFPKTKVSLQLFVFDNCTNMMKLVEQAHLVLYRVSRLGLEVFLVKKDPSIDNWTLPAGFDTADAQRLPNSDSMIELEPVPDEDGRHKSGLAVEADWHDIPSLKALMMHDATYVKNKLTEAASELERQGTFFLVKDAFKKVLPQQYAMLSELRDIIQDRNSTKHL
jgi:hypothetical protein